MADHLLRPNADGANVAWSGTIAPDWDNVDEAVTQPATTGFDTNELSTSGGAGTDTQDVGFATAVVSGSVTQVVVWARAADQNNNAPSSQTTVSVFMGGAWQTAQASGWTSTEAWHSYTFAGSWSQADVDALQVRFTCTRTGMVMAPMRVLCLYAVVTDGGGGGGGGGGTELVAGLLAPRMVTSHGRRHAGYPARGRILATRPPGSADIIPPAPPDAPHPRPRLVPATRPRLTPGRMRVTRPPWPLPEPAILLPYARVIQPRPQRPHRATRPRLLRVAPPMPGALAVAARADGSYRVADPTLVGYLLYRGVDASPDLAGAAYETFAALPHTTGNQPAGATYRFVLRQRNAYGLISQNVAETVLELDGAGAEADTRPSDPFFVEANAGAAGVVIVTAKYAYAADGDNQADAFLVYARTDGTNPDVAIDTPIEVSMAKADGVARLSYSTAALLEDTVAKFIVRTRRNGTPDVDSTNTTIVTATATLLGPAAVSPASAFLGRSAEQVQ